jgi:hypothetical protein
MLLIVLVAQRHGISSSCSWRQSCTAAAFKAKEAQCWFVFLYCDILALYSLVGGSCYTVGCIDHGRDPARQVSSHASHPTFSSAQRAHSSVGTTNVQFFTIAFLLIFVHLLCLILSIHQGGSRDKYGKS